MGVKLSEIDDADAQRLDWLLAIDGIVQEAEAKKIRDMGNGTK